MTQYVENCEVGVEPMTGQERRDLADERDAEAWQALYDSILVERIAKGLDNRPIVIVAEIDKRLRKAREDAI